MYVACSSLCFSRFPLPEALHVISELHFHKVDLAVREKGPHLKPSDVLADANRVAQLSCAKANVAYAAFHVEIDAPTPEDYRDQLRHRLPFGPGARRTAGQHSHRPDRQRSGRRNHATDRVNRIAEAEGVILTVETHSQSLTADPAMAIYLCRQVPGLGLTLDPSQYLVGTQPTQEYDELFPYVRHVRLRLYRPGSTASSSRPGPGGIRKDHQPAVPRALSSRALRGHSRHTGTGLSHGAGSAEVEVSSRKHGVNCLVAGRSNAEFW